ncbi:MAG: cadmium-translocating P-type ATPase [bacterium]|nr:cadmium-translocating P-type ATPase [bacterium]
MTCPNESGPIRQQLLAIVDEDNRLRFDLLRSKLSVEMPDAEGTSTIVAAIARTGQKAEPWSEALNCSCCGEDAESVQTNWFKANARRLLTTASGILLATAFLCDLLLRGPAAALGVHGAELPISPLPLTLYLLAVVTGAGFVAPRAWRSVRTFRPDMNLLMFMAVGGAVALGEFFEAAAVSFLFAFSLLLESWSMGRARRAISSLLKLAPDTARVLEAGASTNGEGRLLPVAEVEVGSRVLIRPGEKIPLDGRVVEGRSAVDQSPITGESIPVDKNRGDETFAGSLNGDGVLEIETTRSAGDSTLAQILRLVEEAQSRRAQTEQWVERFARYYTPAMMAIALLIAVVPPLIGGEWLRWFYQALVILVIACPCALVISTPVSIVAGLARAARAGILIKGGVFLELPSRLRAIAFDKTGTLSAGKPRLEEIHFGEDSSRAQILELAASLEANSGHPLARAVLDAAKAEGVSTAPAEDLQILQGRGVCGEIAGEPYLIGNQRLLDEVRLDPGDLTDKARELEENGYTLLYIADRTTVMGILGVRDSLRPQASTCLTRLRERGIEHSVILSGDNRRVADTLARECGADEVRAELLPADKASAIDEMRERFGACAMVGDGVNDAPALAAADLGIAMGAMGSDTAIETADIALMTDDLLRLPWLIGHSRRVLNVIRQNIFIALGLKVIFMVLAVMNLATLWMAIVADMGASLLVIGNGLRLLGKGESESS